MISVFKINDPYRLILAFILFILFRLPFLISGPVTSTPQLEWLVLGEKMASGASLYVDVFHPTGPVMAGFYWIFNVFFGRVLLPLHIAAMLLIFFQASMLSIMIINHRALNQNTYVPSLVFIVLMAFFPDSAILSPQLISMTFLILAFNLIFRHIGSRQKSDWVVLYAGIYIGLAAMSYLPASIFIVSTALTLLLYTSTALRRYFLLLYGFLVPVLIVWIYYYWRDDSAYLFTNYLTSFRYRSLYHPYNFADLMLLISVPLGFLIISLYRILTGPNLINIQVVQQNFMFLTLLSGFAVVGLDYFQAPHSLIILFFPVSFFISQYFINLRKQWIAELLFLIFTVASLANGYASYFGIFTISPGIDAQKTVPVPDQYNDLAVGRKVLRIGDHTEIYRHARLATPYLSWAVSGNYLDHPEDPDKLIAITQQMLHDLPEIIIDENGLIKKIFSLSPVLAEKYRERVNQKGIYILIN